MSSLGRRLRRLRLERGLTQRELAEPHYTHAYVSTIEADRRQPSPAAVAHFASKLGVDVDELLTGRPPDLVPRLELGLHEARVALSAGRCEDADQTFKRIARDAKRYALPRIQARAAEGRGLCAERLGSAEAGIEHFEAAERILSAGPPTNLAECVAGKARCFQMLGDVRYAIHLLDDFIGTLERDNLRDPDALVKAQATLVGAYFDAGLYRQAEASATSALAMAPHVSDPGRLATMHMNVARILLRNGEKAEAAESLERARTLFAQLDLRTELGQARLARGYVLAREGDEDAAREELTEALAILRDAGAPVDEARVLCELGRLERLAGRTAAAVELLQSSCEILEGRDVPELALATRELGVCFATDDEARAEKVLREAAELFERCDEAVQLAATQRALGDVLASSGNRDAACDAYRAGILAVEERL